MLSLFRTPASAGRRLFFLILILSASLTLRAQQSMYSRVLFAPVAEPATGAASGAVTAPKGTVEGIALDPQGRPIAHAEVAFLRDGQLLATARTDDGGHFQLRLAAGLYQLAVSAPGLATSYQSVTLESGKTAHVGATLQLAQASSSVLVHDPGYRADEQTAATRVPMRALDIPQTVTSISQEFLRDRAVDSMQDALAYTAGVTQILGEGRRDQVSIRGMNANNDMYVDGIKDDAGYYRDLSNTDHIEVVEGPAAVLYGRGTAGGLVDRITKKPRIEGTLAEFSFRTGSYGSKRGEGDIDTLPGSRLFGLRTTGAWENGGSYRHWFSMNRYAFAPSLRWKPAPGQDFLLQIERLRDERIPDRGIPSVNGRPAPVGTGAYYGYAATGGAVPADFLHTGVTGIAATWTGKAGPWNLREAFRRTGYRTAFEGTLPTGVSGSLVTRFEYDGSVLLKNHFSQSEAWRRFKTLGMEHLFVVGIEYGHQSNRTLRYSGTAASVSLIDPAQIAPVRGTSPSQSDRFTGQVWAGYFQDEIALAPHWKTLLGLRMDDYRQSDRQFQNAANSAARRDTQPSPRIGLLYQPTESSTYYASWSHTFDPSGEGLSLTAATSNNTSQLAPEQTSNYELGAKYLLFDGRLQANAALFRLNRTDVKVPDFSTDPSGATYINGGEQRTDGFEANLAGNLTSHWKMIGGWAWMDAYYPNNPTKSSGITLTGKRAQMVPVNSGRLWQMYEWKQGFGLGLGAIAMNSRYASTTNLVKVPGYARLDASAYYRTHRWDLDLHLENLVNTHYYVSAQSDAQIMPGSPIDTKVSFRWKF